MGQSSVGKTLRLFGQFGWPGIAADGRRTTPDSLPGCFLTDVLRDIFGRINTQCDDFQIALSAWEVVRDQVRLLLSEM
jgi:hypothetical protein